MELNHDTVPAPALRRRQVRTLRPKELAALQAWQTLLDQAGGVQAAAKLLATFGGADARVFNSALDAELFGGRCVTDAMDELAALQASRCGR